MESFVFVVFLLLIAGLILSVFRENRGFFKPRLFRWLIVVAAVAFYGWWFFRSSVDQYVENSLPLQIINKLPQPVDFYVLKVRKQPSNDGKYALKHPGKIRSDYYRIAYLNMTDSDEYWIVGYIGKKNIVYFSQHSVPNKNIDQIVEVNNYINQSLKLSETAGKEVENLQKTNMGTSVWVTLGMLLTFLNFILLLWKKKSGN